MVPVLDRGGRSVPLPTWPWNQYGYGLEFDKKGRSGEYLIDFEAIAAHLEVLYGEATKRGAGIDRVIFDPAFLPLLFATSHGSFIQSHMSFLSRQAWVRHDEHYHVDFRMLCRPLRSS